jgi:predicted secreted protein
MRYLRRSAWMLTPCLALLGGILVGPTALGQSAATPTPRPPRIVTDRQVVVPQRIPSVAEVPPQPQPQPARFSLKAPSEVEAGRAFQITIARDRHDGRTYAFQLQFAPDGLIASSPGTITIPDSQESATVRLATVADPQGDGPHTLRVALVPSNLALRSAAQNAVTITVNEPPPARFSLRAPSTVEAGATIPITIARDRNDGRTYDFTLAFTPQNLVVNPPDRITVRDGSTGSVRVATVADPPGDGRHPLRIELIPGRAKPDIRGGVASVSVNEPLPTSFSLRAPSVVKAGEAIPITIVRDRNDGKAHTVRLQFEPANLIANPPGAITVPDGRNGSVSVMTRADPPGDGSHPLRIVLAAGDSGTRIGSPRTVSLSVNEPIPASFSLQAPSTVQAGEAIPITIVRDRNDGRAYDFRLRFEPADLIARPPGAITVPDGRNGSVQVMTRADPPGDGRHPLRISLVAGDGGPRIGSPRAVDLAVNEPPPLPTDTPDDEVTPDATDTASGTPVDAVTETASVTPGDVATGVSNDEDTGDNSAAGDNNSLLAIAIDHWPWAVLVLLLAAGGLLAPGLRKALRERRTREAIKQLDLSSRCEIDPGAPSPQEVDPELRGPAFAVRFDIIPGEADCPDPLPVRETADA